MYDVDGNGWIDLEEMTKLVGSIYKMIGTQQPHLVQDEAVKEKARGIFEVMDINSDGKVTKEEFTKTCLEDKTLIDLLCISFDSVNHTKLKILGIASH